MTIFKSLWNFIGFPLRAFILDEKTQKKIGLTTLKEERFNEILKRMEGKALDVGCGNNELIIEYRKRGNKGIGVDVFPFEGVDMTLNTEKLPFKKEEFDCITLLATLNHIPKQKRMKVIKEINRVLKKNGKLIITMIGPFIGWLCHKLTWWDFDKERRMEKGEEYGLTNEYVFNLIKSQNFKLIEKKKFLYGLNNIFVFHKI